VANLPHTPDRSLGMLGLGVNPLPALLDGIDLLNRNGVELIAIPCNSAHYWYDAMRAHSPVPILHIVETCIAAVSPHARRVAVLATGGTLSSGLFQQGLRARGIEPLVPDEITQVHIEACIRAVKAGDLDEAAEHLSAALDEFIAQGADAAVMGCTEIPLAARHIAKPALTLVDSTLELARATVTYALARGWNTSQ
jgi:aspartate racemase